MIDFFLQVMAKDLSASATETFWIGTSYLLMNAVFQPFIAALSNIFGRRQLYVPCLAFFAIGSIIAATAHSIQAMLAGRSIQGIGGGGISALTLVIITDVIPLRARPKYIAINSAAWAVGTIVGPSIGGLLAEYSSWRWAFWLMLPFCGLGMVLIPVFVRLDAPDTAFAAKLGRVDWIGGAVFIPSTTSFLVAISWGGSQYAWKSWETLVPLFLGLVGIVVSMFWEFRGAREPFLRRSLFHRGSAAASYCAALIQGGLLFGSLYFIPLYFGVAKGLGPTRTGVSLLPCLVSLVPASMVTGIVVTRTGHFRWANWIGWVLVTLCTGLIIRWTTDTSTATWAAVWFFYGVGQGLVLTGLTSATQASADAKDSAHAAAMYTFSRQLGTTLAIPIGTSVFQNLMESNLRDAELPVGIAHNAIAYVLTVQSLPDQSPRKIALIHAYLVGFSRVFAAFTALAGLGLVLCFLIKHMSMNQRMESDQVLRRRNLQPQSVQMEAVENSVIRT